MKRGGGESGEFLGFQVYQLAESTKLHTDTIAKKLEPKKFNIQKWKQEIKELTEFCKRKEKKRTEWRGMN